MISAPSALRHLEPAIDLVVGEAAIRAVVECVDGDAGSLRTSVRSRGSDRAASRVSTSQRFARLLRLLRREPFAPGRRCRLDLRRPEFALREPALFHGRDDWLDAVAASWPRQLAEGSRSARRAARRTTVCARAVATPAECQRAEFTSCHQSPILQSAACPELPFRQAQGEHSRSAFVGADTRVHPYRYNANA